MLRRRRFLTLLGIVAAVQVLVFLRFVSGEPRSAAPPFSDREILRGAREDNYDPPRGALERVP